MALTPGVRLGVYEVIGSIGEGGMGQVFRARDTKLDRDVAIKILPEAFAHDADRLARFQREAKTLASLNHPNIAAIYGLEERGGMTALVMELAEGDDLSQRIARGAIPLDEALPIAKQIAQALEAAHEQGVIHRDLKPANIKVQPDGTVKVLDFGLAKAMSPDGVSTAARVGGAGPSQSPTITTPAMTQAGVILGTAAYMSPEQARGQPVDKRADIWAFGCVLYEMLTGRRAFLGAGVIDTLASVVHADPDWNLVPLDMPPALLVFVRLSLQKDPRQRIADIHDVRLALEGAFETAASQTAAPVVAPRHAGWRRLSMLTAGALVVAAVTGSAVWVATRPVPPRVSRLTITPTRAAALTINGNDRDLAITPDGSRVVYVGNNGTQLFVRAMDALEPVPVFTGMPRGPFVSPDGQWIGFVDGITTLKRVALTGGPAVTLATLDQAPRGATWAPDDTIIVATLNLATGLQRVAAASGSTTVLTRPDRARGEADHLWPELLPHGRAVLFTITAMTGGLDVAQVVAMDLQTGTRTVLVRGGSHAHYVPSGLGSSKRADREAGHLVYMASGALRAIAFDPARLETRGTPVLVVPEVVTTTFGSVDAVVAGDGTLAYVSRGGAAGVGPQRMLVWVDREGHATPIAEPPRAYVNPRLSPDGTRIAVHVQDQERDLWVLDLRRARFSRATFDPTADVSPLWTPNGGRLIFGSSPTGAQNIFWQAADRTGAVEPLTKSPNRQAATDVSPDGRWLIFTELSPTTGEDVMQMALDGPRPSAGSGRGEPVELRRVTALVQSTFAERNGVVSPDGRWLAYEANHSGQFEIYVRPFPVVGSGFSQVSAAGGTQPLWTPSGRELVYVEPTGALMRVGVERGPSWAATTPTLLVKDGYLTRPGGSGGLMYDVALDGQRFLMIKEGGADGTVAPTSLIVVQHWVDELRRLVPTN